MAYYLTGVFSVNMPLLYGEGEKAFIRLQEEIIKYLDDQSMLAWTDSNGRVENHHWLLANSPKHFFNSSNILSYREWESRAPFSLRNKGLRMELHLSPQEEDLYVAALDFPVPPE